MLDLWKKLLLVFCLSFLVSCSSDKGPTLSDTSLKDSSGSENASYGEPCDNANFLSKDGKLWCSWHGTGYWTDRSEATQISNGVFEGARYTGKGSSEQSVDCYDSFFDKGPGDYVTCEFQILVTNVNHRPYDLAGNFYFIVDGDIYVAIRSATNNSYHQGAALEPLTFNPNDSQYWKVTASVPYGSIVTDVFLADSPDGIHLFDVPFAIKLAHA